MNMRVSRTGVRAPHEMWYHSDQKPQALGTAVTCAELNNTLLMESCLRLCNDSIHIDEFPTMFALGHALSQRRGLQTNREIGACLQNKNTIRTLLPVKISKTSKQTLPPSTCFDNVMCFNSVGMPYCFTSDCMLYTRTFHPSQV